jgi:hypothetical protein
MPKAHTLSKLYLLILILAVVSIGVLISIAKGVLSPRSEGFGMLAMAVSIFLINFAWIRHRHSAKLEIAQDDQADTTRQKDMRRIKSALIALPIFLLMGLWLGREAPLPQKIIGTVVNLCLFFYFAWALRRLRQNTKPTAS